MDRSKLLISHEAIATNAESASFGIRMVRVIRSLIFPFSDIFIGIDTYRSDRITMTDWDVRIIVKFNSRAEAWFIRLLAGMTASQLRVYVHKFYIPLMLVHVRNTSEFYEYSRQKYHMQRRRRCCIWKLRSISTICMGSFLSYLTIHSNTAKE